MTGSKDCSQLRIELKGDLLVAFNELIEANSSSVPVGIKSSVEEGDYVGLEEIKWLYSVAKGTKWRIHELLAGTEVVLPEPVEIPRNPELEARVQRLKAEQSNREYEAMTKNVDNIRAYRPDDSISFQLRQVNKQLIAVLQFIFSVGAGFVFGFTGIELLVGRLDFGFRLLLGVICSLVIALAEIYFLAKKLAEELDPPPPRPPFKKSNLKTD